MANPVMTPANGAFVYNSFDDYQAGRTSTPIREPRMRIRMREPGSSPARESATDLEGRRAVGGSPTRDVRIPLHLTAVNGASSVHPTDHTLASVSLRMLNPRISESS